MVQADGVGVEHGTAAPGGESITVEVDDIDVGGAQCDALLQKFGTFIDQCEHAPVYDLFRCNVAALDSSVAGGLLDERLGFRVGRWIATLVVLRPAAAGLLAVAAHLA